MKEFMSIYRGYGQMLGAIAVIAGIATFGMMWLVDANVLSRKLLNQPVMGSVEISQALLVFCIMLGMPYAQVSGAHLRVTMIIGHAPRRISEVLFSLSALVGCIVFAFLAFWILIRSAVLERWRRGLGRNDSLPTLAGQRGYSNWGGTA